MEIIRIPAERVSTLVGKGGKIKDELEKKARVTLNISPEGEVFIEGEMTDVYFAKDIVKAIGRGFEPKHALKLLKEGYCFYLIDLKNELDTENAIKRIRGRIIGEDGKVKTEIEEATDSYISVFGNTVGIISKTDGIEYAKEAVYKLIDGAPHTAVFTYLAKIKRQMFTDRLRGTDK